MLLSPAALRSAVMALPPVVVGAAGHRVPPRDHRAANRDHAAFAGEVLSCGPDRRSGHEAGPAVPRRLRQVRRSHRGAWVFAPLYAARAVGGCSAAIAPSPPTPCSSSFVLSILGGPTSCAGYPHAVERRPRSSRGRRVRGAACSSPPGVDLIKTVSSIRSTHLQAADVTLEFGGGQAAAATDVHRP